MQQIHQLLHCNYVVMTCYCRTYASELKGLIITQYIYLLGRKLFSMQNINNYCYHFLTVTSLTSSCIVMYVWPALECIVRNENVLLEMMMSLSRIPVSTQNFRFNVYTAYLFCLRHSLHYNVLSGLSFSRSKRQLFFKK